MRNAIEWTLVAAVVAGAWLLALAMVPLPAHAGPLHAGACMSQNGTFGWHLAGRINYGDDAPLRVEVAQARPRDMGCGILIDELLALGPREDGS